MRRVLVCVVLILCLVTVAQAETTTVRLNFREGPGTQYTSLKVLPKGANVEVISTSKNWAKVKYNGETGYVYSGYLKGYTSGGGSSATIQAGKAYTKVRCNLREGPGTNYSSLGVIAQYTNLKTGSSTTGWTKVKVGGKIGYIQSNLLANGTTSSKASTTKTKGVLTATTRVAVRVGPGSEYERIGIIPMGGKITVKGSVGNWIIITFNGQTAYTYGQYYN